MTAATDINRLVGEFMTLYDDWEQDPPRFAWQRLQALAKEGAQAYNEGYGPSFHILVFDGYPHGEFHERLLGYLLEAGFDPFKTVPAASGASYIAVFGHDGLAAAAHDNAYSARMLATLHEVARQRLPGMEPAALQRTVMLCSESIPNDLLAVVGPGFARAA